MTMVQTDGKCPAILVLYFVCTALCYPILASQDIKIEAGGAVAETARINCSVTPGTANITWLFQGNPLVKSDRIQENVTITELTAKDPDGNNKTRKTSHLTIANATANDSGEYTCVVDGDHDEKWNRSALLDMSFPAKLLNTTKSPVGLNVSEATTLYCVFEVYHKPEKVRWWQKTDEPLKDEPTSQPAIEIDLKTVNSTYPIQVSGTDVNGTYICEAYYTNTSQNVQGEIDVLVYAKPTIQIDRIIPVNTTELYINWTVSAHNLPIKSYYLWVLKKGDPGGKKSYPKKIGPLNTSCVIEYLENSTEYKIQLTVETSYGSGNNEYPFVKTLDEEPTFVPDISIKGFSATSVTLGLVAPPDKIANLIHYYILEAKKRHETSPRRAYHSRDSRNIPYMFDNLEPYSTYVFQAQACSDYTKRCGPWSSKKEAATLDGIPGRPSEVTIDCNTSRVMNLTWKPPLKPNAEIKGYTMELTGNATYKDRYGNQKETIWGPLTRFTTNDTRTIRFDDLQPNTNYTVRLSAMTRMRRRGEEEVKYCQTKPEPPDTPPRPRWRKIHYNDKYLFKVLLPRITERNGPICCYRVYMVRLPPHGDLKNLLQPDKISIIDYEEAHAVRPSSGAYLTDVFSNYKFPQDTDLVMGDNQPFYHPDDPVLNSPTCRRCLVRPNRDEATTTSTTTSTPTTVADTTEEIDADETSTMAAPEARRRRSNDVDYGSYPVMWNSKVEEEKYKDTPIKVTDGALDSGANYTLFVELIPGTPDEPRYSDYVNVLMPAPSPVPPAPHNMLEVALQVTCGVAALVLVSMIALCVLHTRRARKLPPHAPLEMTRLPAVLRYFVEWGRRPTPLSSAPPEMAPIAKEDLAAAYAERQGDSDYGFQKEFEMLPECFSDRTTHASEARENQPKNRYPDIKAYDQTRVKLSQIDSVTGSDYINANYVMGYRERKQFICAQGPTDTTVNDFWRMIWEHGLELIVMLTNLEEYSKVKCSKYWPDEVRGARNFGSITVHHVAEKRYSDYIVRELRITKQPTNSDGQPIVENNGIAKRNGECVGAAASGGESAPTSPREAKEEARLVRQYHFLMWKDFAAPEHPHSILKFIKRVNEAWAGVGLGGRAAVVHCSAGVGRTGTLVALDCLLEQLRAAGHAAVFNTVADLRRQRNFLVQSLKQYVFVYRALVEYAHYGDTEIPASRLKSAIDRLRNTPEGADKCLMEHEFEKMINSPVPEPVKSCAAGAAEELRARNRSQDCLPYDRNRVILTPIPGRDFSTYINASFIEAYDNSEGFIITQDPLPNTIMDFWRMVSEQNISTIVMLSELGEGKCPRYWDDGTAQYEHISVQYEESESCPYYTRRQFRVTNNKSGETSTVRQLQYQGWPTAPGHVPEVTRGLAELADAAEPEPGRADGGGPMLVHCLYGTERSSLFVALCVLICQLRVERRVDVNSVARKVRSQRAKTIDTFLQYEFLHRAILNYAELHNLLEDS